MRTRCPACNSPKTRHALRIGEYVYKRCSACGALFVANRLAAKEIHDRYSEVYFESNAFADQEGGGYPSYLEATENLERSFRQKLELVRKWKPAGRLLDAGAAYGTFLHVASSHYDCVGLDVSAHAASVARREFAVRVEVGSIMQAPFDASSFDAIVMWDTIEHLVEPAAALAEIYRMLKPSGVVFISTDDVSNWLCKLLGAYWWSISPPLHLCHFSRRGMAAALRRAGEFELIDLVKDKRSYSVSEIIEHLALGYHSGPLAALAPALRRIGIGRVVLNVARPEQFVAIGVKKR